MSRAPKFNIVWGVLFDCMHTEFLEVGKFQYQITCESEQKYEGISISKSIDQLLSEIKPCREVQRQAIPLSNDKIVTAKDFRNWLLFYSTPIYIEFLDPVLLGKHASLVNCTYTSMKNEITKDELNECELALAVYVVNSEKHYGEDRMRFNVHMLNHFTESVRYNGPAWSHSTFPFEGNMRATKKCVNGTREVGTQIAQKTLQLQKLRCSSSCDTASLKVSLLCRKLFDS